MRDLIKKFRRYRAIQDKVAVEELDFFDSLPSFYRGRVRSWFCRRPLIMISVAWLSLRIWTIRVIRLKDRGMIVVVEILVFLGRVMRQRMLLW